MRSARIACVGALLLAAAPAWGLWGLGAETVKALQAQFDAGRYEAVIAQLDPAGLQKLHGQSLRRGYLLLGASYDKAGHPDKALSVYQVGVRLFPRDQDILSRLAVLLHKSGLEEQAQPLYEKLLQVNPDNPYGHWGLAQIDGTLGFLDRSADHYEKTLQDLPERGDIWQEYAEVLYEARDYRTAELAVQRALALTPSDAATMDLALILRAMNRLDEALATLGPFCRAGRTEAVRACALWRMEAGHDEEAQAAAGALLRRNPADPLARYVRARLALKAGRRVQALQDLDLAAARGEESPFTAKVCAALASLVQGRR